jgi:hypothetical protein
VQPNAVECGAGRFSYEPMMPQPHPAWLVPVHRADPQEIERLRKNLDAAHCRLRELRKRLFYPY